MRDWLRRAREDVRVLFMLTAFVLAFVCFGLGVSKLIEGLFSDGFLFICGSLMCFAVSMRIERHINRS